MPRRPALPSLQDAPIGTRAPAVMGGWWYKVGPDAWKWNGPDGCGSTFPSVGGDWTGRLIYPDDEKESP